MGRFTDGEKEIEAVQYSGWMTPEMRSFVGEALETEQRDGMPVMGTFIRILDGRTKMPSKKDWIMKFDDGGLDIMNEYSFQKTWWPTESYQYVSGGSHMKTFVTARKIENIVYDDISIDQFKNMLLSDRPDAIWNNQYSSKVPCYYLSDYTEEGVAVKAHASLTDSLPEFLTWDRLYGRLRISGLGSFHILSTEQ